MENNIFNETALNIWQPAQSRSTVEQLRFELDIQKKLLQFFQVGDQYYFVFNVSMFDLEMVSEEIKKVLGYDPAEFTLKFFLDKVHPQDRPYFLNFENKVAEFLMDLPPEKLMKYKVRHDYRIQKKNGEYVRILQQSVVIEHDDAGRINRTFATHTDIGHLKASGRPVLSIIGLEGEPSYLNINVEKIFAVSDELLTGREKEILRYLFEGKLSKEIAAILHISKQTVDKHRKNMLTKCKLNNTRELVAKAINEGWL